MASISRLPRHARWALNYALAAIVMLPLLGCAPDEETAREANRPLPSWANKVYPAPGQESSGVRAVEVQHRILDELENVHLKIDDVDVTQYARHEPTLLHYDPRAPGSPVRLRPGRHSAEITLVRLPEFGADSGEVIGRFRWSFSIQ